MKKLVYALVLLLAVSGLVLANRDTKNETPKNATTAKPAPPPLTAAERNAERAKWEATPEGIRYTNWTLSPEGKKVLAATAKISQQTKNFSAMEAVVTSLTLPPGSRLGFGIMVRIDDEDYILSFGLEPRDDKGKKDFMPLHELKANDKIIIRSRGASHAPKYDYPILSGDYVEQGGKVIYTRSPVKGGC